MAARFPDHGDAEIFKKLWRTAPDEEKQRIRSLFSVKKKHANLSGVEYVLEALDPRHRLEHRGGLADSARMWVREDTSQYFFPWLEKSDRNNASPMTQVAYFDEKARSAYHVDVGSALKYTTSKQPLEGENIYVLSQADDFYASDGETTDTGVVHHSSFMAGQAVKAAGHMTFQGGGKLEKINLNSGHYKPKAEHMKNVLRLLDAKRVDLGTVTACPAAGGQEHNAKQWLQQRR